MFGDHFLTDACFHKSDLKSIVTLKTFQINMLQRNSFQWFHETELPMEALTPVMPIRPQLMTDLRNCVTVMLQSHEELVRSQSKFQVLAVLNLLLLIGAITDRI
jgi:hypothetical protein